jgi:hypothetical protein
VTSEVEPVKVIPSGRGSRFPHGLFVVAIELYADRVALRIFLSRPRPVSTLQERLTLSDSTGTKYVMQAGDSEIDGKGTIEFRPAVPREATWLKLEEPGTGLVVLRPWEEDPCWGDRGCSSVAGYRPGHPRALS